MWYVMLKKKGDYYKLKQEWEKFVDNHGLVKNDVLLFDLIEPEEALGPKYRVTIIKP